MQEANTPRDERPIKLHPPIQELGLRNFKAFGNNIQRIPLSRITLIYGPNSGGKSSVVQALLALKQSEVDSRRGGGVLEPRGDLVDLAGFSAMVHSHDEQRDVEIRLLFTDRYPRELPRKTNVSFVFRKEDGTDSDLPVLSSIYLALVSGDDYAFEIRLFRKQSSDSQTSEGGIFDWGNSEESVYSYGGYLRRLVTESKEDSSEDPLDFLTSMAQEQFSHLGAPLSTEPNFEHFLRLLRNVEFRTFSSLFPRFVSFAEGHTSDESPESSEIQDFRRYIDASDVGFIDLSGDFRILLNNLSYLGPVLDEPRRIYSGRGGQPSAVGKRGEFTFDIISIDDKARKAVDEYFKKFEIPYKISGLQAQIPSSLTGMLGTIVLEDLRNGVSVTPVDVGYGISQILPLIVEAAAGRSAVVCVDQPEVHLHPKLQAEIAELLIDTMPRKQWIVETHSELLLRRIQRRIAEEQLKHPEERAINACDVSVIYIDPSDSTDSGGSTIKVMELAENGDLVSEWPEGFFEEGYHEMMAKLFAGERS